MNLLVTLAAIKGKLIRSNSYDEHYGKYVFDHPKSLTKNPKLKTLFPQEQTFLNSVEKRLDFTLLRDEGGRREEELEYRKEDVNQKQKEEGGSKGGKEERKKLESWSGNKREGGGGRRGGGGVEGGKEGGGAGGEEDERGGGRKRKEGEEAGGGSKYNHCKSATLPRKHKRRMKEGEIVEEEEELEEEKDKEQREEEEAERREEENGNNSPNKSVNLCLVCYDSPPDAVFMDCGHGGICYKCSLELSKATGECFLCRKPIKQVLKYDLKERGEFFRVVEAAEVVDRV